MRGGIFVGPGIHAGIAFARSGPPLPLQCAGFRITGLEEAGVIEMVASDAYDDVIADYHGRYGRRVIQLGIGDRNFPALLASTRVETDQVAIGGFEVQPVGVHAAAAITNGRAGVGRIFVVPELVAGARVGGPHVVGRGEIENALDQQRRGFDLDSASAAGAGTVITGRPGECEVLDVRRVDLI